MKRPSRDLIVARIQYLESIRSYLYSCTNEATVLLDKRMSRAFSDFRKDLNDIVDDLYLEVE